MSNPLDAALNNILTSAQLPILPAVAARLLELTAQEDTSFTDIVNLIAQDMALSAKLLKVANSSFYSFPQQITSINQAVSLLGIKAVRSLILSFTFLTMGEQRSDSLFNFALFWERSLVGATAAKLIAELVPHIDTDEIFTIGLLQNIGQLIFALTVSSRYNHILELLAVNEADISEETLEEEYLALSHTTSGFEVARVWGLPSSILAAIRYHHNPTAYTGDNQQERLTVKIVYLADLVTKIFYSCVPERHYKQLQDEAQQLLGLDGLTIKNFLKIIDQEIDKAARFFDISIHPIRPVAEIIQEANIRLSLLHLSYEEINQELTHAKQELETLRQQLVERNRLLETLANIDGLTETHNHRYFQNFLQSEIQRTIRNKGSLTLLLADIDHFKQFNDTYGHQTGDFILKELCLVAKAAIRDYDLMARYGGEEFAFVLPETDSAAALVVAERLCTTIAAHDFFDGQQHYRVSVSIGVASSLPTSTDFSQNDFIDMVDQALYEAKKQGRNQVAFSTPKKKTRWFAP
jgi:two-component system, cell cycle response regulator